MKLGTILAAVVAALIATTVAYAGGNPPPAHQWYTHDSGSGTLVCDKGDNGVTGPFASREECEASLNNGKGNSGNGNGQGNSDNGGGNSGGNGGDNGGDNSGGNGGGKGGDNSGGNGGDQGGGGGNNEGATTLCLDGATTVVQGSVNSDAVLVDLAAGATLGACATSPPPSGGAGGGHAAVEVPQVNNTFLCYSKFETDGGAVFEVGEAAKLLALGGYWQPYAVAGQTPEGPNVGAYHLVCNPAAGQADAGFAIDLSVDHFDAAGIEAYRGRSGDAIGIYEVWR